MYVCMCSVRVRKDQPFQVPVFCSRRLHAMYVCMYVCGCVRCLSGFSLDYPESSPSEGIASRRKFLPERISPAGSYSMIATRWSTWTDEQTIRRRGRARARGSSSERLWWRLVPIIEGRIRRAVHGVLRCSTYPAVHRRRSPSAPVAAEQMQINIGGW